MSAGQRPGFGDGVSAPFNAAGFLARHKKLIPWALAPLLLNILLFAGLIFWGHSLFKQTVNWALTRFQGWVWAALIYFLAVLAALLVLVILAYLFTLVGNVLAAPFLEVLSRKTEEINNPLAATEEEFSFGQMLKDMARAAGQALKRLALYLLALGLILLLNLAPFIGPTACAAMTWLATGFFLALEFLDYPLDRRRLPLSAKLAYVWGLGWGWLGFGGVVLFMAMVPGLNLLFLPLAGVGGTLLFSRDPKAAALGGKPAPIASPPPPPPPVPPATP